MREKREHRYWGRGFIRDVKEKLGAKVLWWEIVGAQGSYELREPTAVYEDDFTCQNEDLRQENALFWDLSI
jgi:hypothetical protein